MDTENLIKEARARFDFNNSKQYLKEKYEAKLYFADQGGLWLAGPALFSILQSCVDNEIIICDTYGNPIKIDRTILFTKANEIYRHTMKEWHEELETLKNQR